MGFLAQLQRTATRLYRARANRVRATFRDRRLASRLRTAFERDLELAGVKGLHFYTFKGIVTVYGTVRHELDRDLLVGFIRQIQGVKGVVEHLRIEAFPLPAAEPAANQPQG